MKSLIIVQVAFFILLFSSRQAMAFDYDLIVIGAGPGGLQAANASLHYGVQANRILVLEKRQVAVDYGTRNRVIVLDDRSVNTLKKSSLQRLPGILMSEMVAYPSRGEPTYIPNNGGWKAGVNTLFGGRDYEILADLNDIERVEIEANQKLGVPVHFGESVEVKFDANGMGSVLVNGKTLTSELIAVMDGDNGTTAAEGTRRITIDENNTSRYLSIDVQVTGSFDARPGYLLSHTDIQTGAIVYGFVSPNNATVTMLLPPQAHLRERGQRGKYLALLKSVANQFGIRGAARVPEGVMYNGQLAMMDKIVRGNVIYGGNRLRSTDPIAGTGGNAAIADGDAIGTYFGFKRKQNLGSEEALLEVRNRLAEHTRFAFEHSLYFRELASWMRKYPKEAESYFWFGLSGPNGGSGAMDVSKNIWAAVLPRFLVDPEIQSRLKRETGIDLPFESAARERLIGTVHPAESANSCSFTLAGRRHWQVPMAF